MEKIYFDLFRVRDQVLAMQNLNDQELDLRARMHKTQALLDAPQKKKNKYKVKPVVLFLALLILFSLFSTVNNYDGMLRMYENEAYLDEWAWNMNHQDDNEPYPGYDEKRPTVISAFFISFIGSLPACACVAGIYGAMYYISASSLKKEYERRVIEVETRNEQISIDNEHAHINNVKLQEQIQQIHAKKLLISQEYRKEVVTWFPKDFGYLSAIDYFINLAENHIASTIPDMVDRYLAEMRHQQEVSQRREMINNQKIMIRNQTIMISKQDCLIRQQMLGNMINMANLAANQAAADASQRTADTMRNIYNRMR